MNAAISAGLPIEQWAEIIGDEKCGHIIIIVDSVILFGRLITDLTRKMMMELHFYQCVD